MNETRPWIMVVDDDDGVRESMVDYLEDQGWKVTRAASGEEALALLESQRHQAALVDIRLPGMDGAEFLRAARRINPRLAAVVCTGSPQYRLPEDLRDWPTLYPKVFHKPVLNLGALLEALAAGLPAEAGPERGDG